MENSCRYLAVFVFLYIVTLIYFYITVSNDTTIPSNKNIVKIIQRDHQSSNPKSKGNMSLEQEKYENYKRSTLLSILKSGRTMQTDDANHLITNAGTLNATVQVEAKKKHLKSTLSSFITHTESMKAIGYEHNVNLKKENTTDNNYNVFRNASRRGEKSLQTFDQLYQKNSACMFYFDKDSFRQAKEKLSQPQSFYLFYINVEGDPFTNFSNTERDDLLHWQYIAKGEKYIIQLPVDFDMISFFLLLADKEETVLSLTLLYNKSNCIDNFDDAKESIRILLWNELFENNTGFFLCNRHYKEESGRFWMYAITTIWIGFDLTCSEIISGIGILEYPITKDDLLLIYPIFCYLLSLQFVWFLVLLDIEDTHQENFKDQDIPEAHEQNQLSNVSSKENGNQQANNRPFFYIRHDRPYGLKRLFIKLLYYKFFANSSKDTQNKCGKCSFQTAPSTRLILFVWLTILAPFGLYRTIARYCLGMHIYNDYLNVVLPSEPLLYIINMYIVSISPGIVLLFDIVYAIVCPLLLLWLVKAPYKTYMFHELYICYAEENDNETMNNKRNLRDRFIFPCSLICKIICFKHCTKSRYCLWNCCFLVYLIMCLFPFIPFFCAGYKSYLCSKCCKSLQCSVCSNCLKNIMKFIGMCFVFLISYFICFRSIISLFTFLFRAFTYIFFVALPIRVDIMQFTLVLGSIIVYISNYICEIINMNEEILEYIFELKRENKEEKQSFDTTIPKEVSPEQNRGDLARITTPISSKNKHKKESDKPTKLESHNEGNTVNSDECASPSSSFSTNLLNPKNTETQQVEIVKEEEFDAVYEQLLFVNKRLYFLCVKSIVVIMYFIIIVNSFLFDRKSMNAPHFRDIFSIILVIIGPYAISFFLKGNNHNFLNTVNKSEIKTAYNCYLLNVGRIESFTNERNSNIDHKSSSQSIAMKTFSPNNDRTRLLDENNEMGYGTMDSKC